MAPKTHEQISTNQREFLLDALKQGLRIDRRDIRAHRPYSFTFLGSDLGTVECALGRTRILSKVSCEMVKPRVERPTEGFISFVTEFTGMGSLAFESTPGSGSTEQELLLSRTMEKLFKSSRAIDTESLCIVAGKLVWSIKVSLHVLDYDGNLVDCACTAVITSLLHFRRPDVGVVGEEVIVHTAHEKWGVPLSVHHVPLTTTFTLFLDGDTFVMDANLQEEQVKNGEVVVGMNTYKELCILSKAGGVGTSMQMISMFCELAYVNVVALTSQIHNAIKLDLEKRNIEKDSFRKKK